MEDNAVAPKTILVVDDESGIRMYVAAVLEQKKYMVLTAGTAAEALTVARQHTGDIDLLLSNIQMPGMTGIELATALTAERPDTHVMLMSGFSSGLLILNDGWHFLPKPFVPSKLLSLVAGILDGPPVPTIADLNEHQVRGGTLEDKPA